MSTGWKIVIGIGAFLAFGQVYWALAPKPAKLPASHPSCVLKMQSKWDALNPAMKEYADAKRTYCEDIRLEFEE